MSRKDPLKDYRELAKLKKEYFKFESDEKLTWCSGCGDYSIQKALERALVLEKLTPDKVAMFFDIGCHGNGADKIGGYTFHGLHGRVIPAAAGAALANRNVKVIAEGGDGGTLSEGINHLVHAVRSNYPVTFILHNNENYGLTTGQASSTTRKGYKMNTSPDGVVVDPMNVCEFMLGLQPTFVARSFSGDTKHITDMIRAGLNHDGFAFIEVMQVCPTYNRATPQHWYWDKLRYLDELKGYNPADMNAAKKAAADLDKEIKIGVLYQDKESLSFEKRLPSRVDVKTSLVDECAPVDIKSLLKNFE